MPVLEAWALFTFFLHVHAYLAISLAFWGEGGRALKQGWGPDPAQPL